MSDKVAVVVGGGSGMGAACARRLREDGFDIAILTSSGKGVALAETLGGFALQGSNRSEDDLRRLCEATLDRFGRIDAVVNSAGHGPKGDLLSLTDEEWREGMEFYLLNVVRAARIFAPVMERQRTGSIVNISTFATFEPDPAFPTSGVFRAGLASFAKLFADRYGPSAVRMNNVLPGFIDSLPVKAERETTIPMGRYGTADEVAELVLFLASSRSAYMTGQNLRLDGGLTRSV